MSHRAASRKPYSPRRHGDTEKNKVKGKTGAHGGGGGHGAVKSPRSEESSLRAKISAASNTKHRPAFRRGACSSLPRREELARKRAHGKFHGFGSSESEALTSAAGESRAKYPILLAHRAIRSQPRQFTGTAKSRISHRGAKATEKKILCSPCSLCL